MTALTSSVPAVRRALQTRILNLRLTDGRGEPVQLAYGRPATLEREAILIGEVRTDADQTWGRLGQSTRREHYVIECYIVVARPGDDCQAASERAWEILATIETDLRSSKAATTLGLTASGVTDVGVVNPVDQFGGDDEGYACQLTFGIKVNGLLTGGTA